MSRIDFRQIRAFCAVYEEGSISGAAKRLRIAQPNISVAIKNLEFDLCKQMFERSSTGVKPTPVARIFYSRLQPALAHLEAAHHEVKEAPAAATGVLRVGMTTIVARGMRPGLLPQLLANHPDLDFRLTEDSAGSMVNLLIGGELGIAFMLTGPTDSRLVARTMVSEPMVLVSSIRNVAVPRGLVDLTSTPPLKLAVPWGGEAARHPLAQFLSSGRVSISQMMNVTAFNLLLDLVRNSDWMTLMPLSTLAGDLEDLALREVVNSNVIAEYFVVRSAAAKFNEAADSFIEGLMRALDHARGLCRQYIANLPA